MNKIIYITFLLLVLSANVTFAQTKPAKAPQKKKGDPISNDTLRTNSGMKYVIIKRGEGEKPWPGNKVSIYYSLKFLNGKTFSSNFQKEVFTYKLGDTDAIKALNEGLALMKQGDRFRFMVPPELAYGSGGELNQEGKKPKYLVEPNTPLILDVELLEFKK